jgi:hypothetical protein
MSTSTAAAILVIGVPVAFNVAFGVLSARFDYPDILRRPTDEVLARFREGGTGLMLVWWAFMLTAVLLAPLAVLLAQSLHGADTALLATGATIGVLAAAVQFLGLSRWPFLVPYLARAAADSTATPARREAIDVVFQSSNRYLGIAVGEHLGYALSGAWSVLTGAAIIQSTTVPSWLGVVGIAVGASLMLCSLEFVGRAEDRGWSLAEKLTPIAYVAWSLWLIATGIALVT